MKVRQNYTGANVEVGVTEKMDEYFLLLMLGRIVVVTEVHALRGY